jgi:hypothetical protein
MFLCFNDLIVLCFYKQFQIIITVVAEFVTSNQNTGHDPESTSILTTYLNATLSISFSAFQECSSEKFCMCSLSSNMSSPSQPARFQYPNNTV